MFAHGSRHRLVRTLEVESEPEGVYDLWTRYEELPKAMMAVRRVKQVDESRLLWDVDVMGRQIVWEARLVESRRPGSIRWRTTWGAVHDGRVRFEALEDGRTRIEVEIAVEPRGLLERIGLGVGILDACVARNLEGFRRLAEKASRSRERNATRSTSALSRTG